MDLGVWRGSGGRLKDVLEQVEGGRRETVAAINRGAFWRVPMGAAAGVALVVVGQFSDDAPDFLETLGLLIVSLPSKCAGPSRRPAWLAWPVAVWATRLPLPPRFLDVRTSLPVVGLRPLRLASLPLA